MPTRTETRKTTVRKQSSSRTNGRRNEPRLERFTIPPLPLDEFLRQRTLPDIAAVEVEERTLMLSDLSMALFPSDRITRGDLIRYYSDVSEYLLQYLLDRPLLFRRYPNGIGKGATGSLGVREVPDYVNTLPLRTQEGGLAEYFVCNDLAPLLYLLNHGVVELFPWHSRNTTLEHPDWIVFDLDPTDGDFRKARQAALMMRGIFEKIGIESYPMTSGATGIHIRIPLQLRYSYGQSIRFAEHVAQLLAHEHPYLVSASGKGIRRSTRGLVHIDYSKNVKGVGIVAPYSVRAREGAPVATPLRWDELHRNIQPSGFTLKTIRKRLEKEGDLMHGVLIRPQNIDAALRRLEELADRYGM